MPVEMRWYVSAGSLHLSEGFYATTIIEVYYVYSIHSLFSLLLLQNNLPSYANHTNIQKFDVEGG